MPTVNVSITWTPPGTPITETVAVTYTDRTITDVKGSYTAPTITNIEWPAAMTKDMHIEFTKVVYTTLNKTRPK